jgi:myosin heavy subunit
MVLLQVLVSSVPFAKAYQRITVHRPLTRLSCSDAKTSVDDQAGSDTASDNKYSVRAALLEKSLTVLKDQLAEANADKQKSEESLKQLRSIFEKVVSKSRAVTEELSATKEEVAAMQQENKENQDASDSLAAELAEYRSKTQNLEKTVSDHESSNEELQEIVEKLERRNRILQSGVAKLREQYETLKNEYENNLQQERLADSPFKEQIKAQEEQMQAIFDMILSNVTSNYESSMQDLSSVLKEDLHDIKDSVSQIANMRSEYKDTEIALLKQQLEFFTTGKVGSNSASDGKNDATDNMKDEQRAATEYLIAGDLRDQRRLLEQQTNLLELLLRKVMVQDAVSENTGDVYYDTASEPQPSYKRQTGYTSSAISQTRRLGFRSSAVQVWGNVKQNAGTVGRSLGSLVGLAALSSTRTEDASSAPASASAQQVVQRNSPQLTSGREKGGDDYPASS